MHWTKSLPGCPAGWSCHTQVPQGTRGNIIREGAGEHPGEVGILGNGKKLALSREGVCSALTAVAMGTSVCGGEGRQEGVAQKSSDFF